MSGLKKKLNLNYDHVTVLTFSSVTKLHVTELSNWIEKELMNKNEGLLVNN